MKWFSKQSSNPDKHADMPSDYPYQVSDTLVSGWDSLEDAAFESYKSSFDLTAYNTNFKKVPRSVTPRQMRTALILSGRSLTMIEDTISTMSEPDRSIYLVAWEYSIECQRTNPLINALAPALGLTQSQIDDLFILAATL
jgi:hypothetical protein